MAASHTVPELSSTHKQDDQLPTLWPNRGTVTLAGYGIAVRVDRGHLVLHDGFGSQQRNLRLSRVRHGLKRLIVIGTDGSISLAAMRWLTDQRAALVVLERDGTLVATTIPGSAQSARLRRAQALAIQQSVGADIVRHLMDLKLKGQRFLVSQGLDNPNVAGQIESLRASLSEAATFDAIRMVESQAAMAYWSAWQGLGVRFPTSDLRRTPAHWLTFDTRHSPLTGSPRRATNPVNAMLNYLYALVEAEARMAAIAVGLDPALGLLHADTDNRDSLACDLMEAIRPHVDAYVLDWLTREPLRRSWFFEDRDGNCRLMASLAIRLAETVPTWTDLVAPIAEYAAQALARATKPTNRSPRRDVSTPLTQARRRAAQGGMALASAPLPEPMRVCRECGGRVIRGAGMCRSCQQKALGANFPEVLALARENAHSASAQAQRAQSQRAQRAARRVWERESSSEAIDLRTYQRKIQPTLVSVRIAAIASALKVSYAYAARIQKGIARPHARHWSALAALVGNNPKDPV